MNLTTTYLGLTLDNPLVASAGPLSRTVDGARHLADAGVGAIVLIDGLTEWLKRKGFSGVDDVRGLLAVPAGGHGSAFERAGYLTAIEEATRTYGPR
jgi:hypothetical protein